MPESFYITTPIYYVNAKPHLGHAYTTIAADVMARFMRMKGFETFFLTGTDEHGDKIVEAAKKAGVSPREYVDEISGMFKKLWPELGISNDHYIRTTDKDHIKVVEKILQKIYDSGDIYFSEYEGLYCFGCERFYTERELEDGLCPDHKKAPKKIKESNYFFRMSKYQDWLIDHIKKNPDFIRPERYRNEVISFLKEPLEDLCISRPKTRLKWGITLPFDKDYVTYVWFDALVNYISALGYPDGEKFRKFWPSVQHLVAKDIIKPHGIYWPIMLKAAGIEIYNHLNVHGFWNIEENKMSKSLGNVVEPGVMKDRYGKEAFRYFLMREMAFGLDSGFSEKALVQRINSDLANDLGNLFSRVLAMVHKYFDGIIPEKDEELSGDFSLGLMEGAGEAVDDFEKHMNLTDFAPHRALEAVWGFIGKMNKYIDVTAPWTLAKKKNSRKELSCVIYNLLEGLRIISGLIYPVMPDTSMKMQKHLGQDASDISGNFESLRGKNILKPGTRLPKSVTLFPRIDPDKQDKPAPENLKETQMLPDIKPEITFDDFSRIDLRVVEIIEAEKVPKSKKLLKLLVNMGNETRTIVAGISGSYEPDNLIGKQVILVANLKPAKLMGVLSKGMILAAKGEDRLCLSTIDMPVAPGTPLS